MPNERIRILATAYDYRPGLGGVATCAYETVKALHKMPEVDIQLLARHYENEDPFDKSQGFTTKRIKLSSNTPQASLQIAYELFKQKHSWNPDVILNFLWLPCGLATYLAKIPYFVYAHGNEIMETDRTLYKRIRGALSPVKKAVFNRSSGVFAVSQYTANLLSNTCDVPRSKIHVIPNGVDTVRFQVQEKPKNLLNRYAAHNKFVFLIVTRLEDYKGVDQAILALAQIKSKHPEAILIVCGTGPDQTRLENLRNQLSLENRVVFAGKIPEQELLDYYNLSDCFMLLSRTDLKAPNVEGFGIVFLEAAACGKPTIGGRSGGIPDAVEDKVTGLLVDPMNPKEIASAMSSLLEHPNKAKEMGTKGRARTVASFQWKHSAEKLLKIIRSTTKGH